MNTIPTAPTSGHVILCGLNELGFQTLEELCRLGEEVVVVARASREEFAAGAKALGVTLLEGSYRQEQVLRTAGVQTAAALVVTEDDDVGNVHAALVAHDLNPRLRIRLRMFNQELGRRVQLLFRDCQVLDAAAMAVPAFVSAALHRDRQQRLQVNGRRLVVRPASPGEPGVIMPLAHVLPDGDAELFPPAGDDQLCLADDPPTSEPEGAGGHRVRRRRTPARTVVSVGTVLAADRRLRILAAILAAICVLSVLIFARFKHLDLVDAVYFTVTVVTTTGFGDINLLDAPGALEFYGVALMLFGTGTLTVLFALLTDAIVSARLARAHDPIPRHLSDHVVVCGLGNIGYRVVEQLAPLDVPVVAVELDGSNRFLPAMRRLGVPVLAGDIRLRDTLQALHVASARSIVVVTSSDIVNLEAALNARALRPDLRVVLRLYDSDLAARVERGFDFHSSRSPSTLAAPAFAAAAVGEHVIASIPAGRRVLLVARLRVGDGSQAAGVTVAGFEEATRGRVLALAEGGQQRWCPAGDTSLIAGEELTVVVTRQGLAEALSHIEAPEKAAPEGGAPQPAPKFTPAT
ncbi:MAG TPA: NAD-binding protein [Actinomycetes bacterium]|nr:NAD-binding protein [Actinomycetes bacterium]